MPRVLGHLPAVGTLTFALALGAFAAAAPAATAQVAPTSHTASAVMFGATVPSQAAFNRDTADFGHMAIVHTYYSGLPDKNAWTRGLSGEAHSAVIVSFNAKPADILDGHDNAALSQFFGSAPTGHTIYYCYGHEPEHQIAHGGLNLKQYLQAWARVVALAKAAHNPDLHSMAILEAYDLKPSTHRNWKSYLPGGGIISTIGWDAYPGGNATQLTPPAQFMGPAVAASKAAHLPFGFAEFGVTNQPGRAAWLTAVGSYIKSSGALFGTLFDSQPKGTPPLTLNDSASIAAWRAVVHSSGADPGASQLKK